MTTKPETKIVNAIQVFVKEQGGEIVKQHGSVMSRLGEPDLIGGIVVKTYYYDWSNDECLAIAYVPISFAVEVKQATEDVRSLQAHRLKAWKNVGWVTGRVDSVESFQALIKDQLYLLWDRHNWRVGQLYNHVFTAVWEVQIDVDN